MKPEQDQSSSAPVLMDTAKVGNDEWTEQRSRVIALESSAPIGDDPPRQSVFTCGLITPAARSVIVTALGERPHAK